MTRRCWIAAALCLTACRTAGPRDAASLLPPNVGTSWQRRSLRGILPPPAGVKQAFEATYDGSGNLTVDLYETKASGTAFEMTQHWRAAPDSVCFDKGRYFVVVKWQRADRQALTQFVRELQSGLAAAQ